VFAGLQRLDNPLLVRGRDAGEERGLFGSVGKLLVSHLLQLIAQQNEFRGKPHLFAYLAGDQVVITGQNLDQHAMPCKSLMAAVAVSLGGSRNAT